MEKKNYNLNDGDLPDDLSKLPKDTIITLDDHDPMEDDEFWEQDPE